LFYCFQSIGVVMKVLLTVFALSILFTSVAPSFDVIQVRGDHDRKGPWNKYEDPYTLWPTMP